MTSKQGKELTVKERAAQWKKADLGSNEDEEQRRSGDMSPNQIVINIEDGRDTPAETSKGLKGPMSGRRESKNKTPKDEEMDDEGALVSQNEGEEEEEEDAAVLLEKIDERIPQIQCDRGFQHSLVNRICTIKTCGKKLLCDKCLETDHQPLQKYSKTFGEFFKLKKSKKVVKEKLVLDIEFFLQEKQQFATKLEFAYNMASQTVEKEFEVLETNLTRIIQEAKQTVHDFKKKHFESAKAIVESLQPQLDEIYFDIDSEMRKLTKVQQFEEMNEIIKNLVEFPNQNKIEKVSNDFRLISYHIKEFESDASLYILKQVSPKIEDILTKELACIADETEARRVLLEQDGVDEDKRESIWNSGSAINYKTLQRKGPDPILCACEVDQNFLVFGTGSPGNNILVYDMVSNQFRDEFSAHEGSVMSIIHYHDSIILSAGSDGVIKFWDINDSENFKTFQAHSEILMDLCKISPRLFASSSFDNTIKIWNFESGSQSPDGTLVGHSEGIFQTILLNEEDQLIASCSADYNVKIWNLARLECIGTLKGHKNQVNSIQKIGDDRLISGGDDNALILWNWKTLDKVGKFDCIPFSIWNIRLMNDMKSLIVCGEDISIFVINVEDGQIMSKLFGHKSFPRSILQIKSGSLLTFGYDSSVKFWKSKKLN